MLLTTSGGGAEEGQGGQEGNAFHLCSTKGKGVSRNRRMEHKPHPSHPNVNSQEPFWVRFFWKLLFLRNPQSNFEG